MKKEFIDAVLDITPIIAIVSISSSFVKGVKSMKEYIKALIASYIVGIPGSFLAEHIFPFPEKQTLKYVVVLTLGTFGICIFNGIFKIFKHFESNPAEVIEVINKRIKK